MKLMKVFDCQDMPDSIRTSFFDNATAGNDCYIRIFVEPYEKLANNVYNYDVVCEWLLKNGAEPWDEVIVKHWW